MASTQAGLSPGGGDQNDPNRGPPNKPPSYDWTSSSSSGDSSSGEELAYKGGPEEDTRYLPPEENERQEANAKARAPIRKQRDIRRRELYYDKYEMSWENGIDLREIHQRNAMRRRIARDARPSRGQQYKYDADDEAKRMTREYRRQLRRQGRLRRLVPEPHRDPDLQEVDHAARDARRDSRRGQRNTGGSYNAQMVEDIANKAAAAKRREQEDRRLSGQSAPVPGENLPALVETMLLYDTHGSQNPGQSEQPQAPGNFQLATQHERFLPPPPPPTTLKQKAKKDGNKGAPAAKRTRRKTAGESERSPAPPTGLVPAHPDGAAPQGPNVPTGYQPHSQQGPSTATFSEPGPSQQPQQNPGLGGQPGAQGRGYGEAGFPPAGLVPTQTSAGPNPVTAPQPPPQAGGDQSAGGNGKKRKRNRAARSKGKQAGSNTREADNNAREADSNAREAVSNGGESDGNGREADGNGKEAGRKRKRGKQKKLPAPNPRAWAFLNRQIHPVSQPYYRQGNEYPGLLSAEARAAIENRVLEDTQVGLETADKAIKDNHGKEVSQGEQPAPPSPVARETYTVDQWPEKCERCLRYGLPGCNIRQLHEQNPLLNPTPECDNCVAYRYGEENYPEAIDHDCRFEPGPGRALVTAERRRPSGMVVDFLRGLLWQCDHCAREGRYCDADRLMSVRCTTCQSLGRECSVRGSPALRERDYMRAFERSFRIMCRLCCKAGKQCSWTDSTENYLSGQPCRQCVQFQEDSQRFGACTTFSKLPVSVISGGFNPLPMANVLPAVDELGEPLMIRQRPPWRNRIPPKADGKVRHRPNGDILSYIDPNGPDYPVGEEARKKFEEKNPEGRKECEFCYYTVSLCTVGKYDKDKACTNCTFLGMKCLSREDLPTGAVAAVPRQPREWWNLANGMGHSTKQSQWGKKFKHCANCVDKKRTCDRKRPCESCRDHGEQDQCDQVTWGEGVFVADRHAGDRGHSYYLGMGYGPQGLGTPMLLEDPTHMACGPKTPHVNGMPSQGGADPQGRERLRAARCREREAELRRRHGNEYSEPGLGRIPFELDIDRELPDPTAAVGWPGSFILNNREPVGSRAVPLWRWHPPGIAAYQDVGVEHGAPIPEGLQPEAPPEHPPLENPPPAHPPLAQPSLEQALPAHPPLASPPPAQAPPAQQQPQQPANDGGQGNLPEAGPVDDIFTIIDNDEYLNSLADPPGAPEAQPPFNIPQEQPGQGPPVANDEVMGDAGVALDEGFAFDGDFAIDGNFAFDEGGLGGFGYGAPPDDQPPGMNAFVPAQEEPEPASAPPSAGLANDALDVFKLGAAFTGVERFVGQKNYEESLVEDPNATEPAPGVAGVEPPYPWMAPPYNAPEESQKAAALNRMDYPGNNILRDIPEEAATDGGNGHMPCKDRKPPLYLECGKADGHGRCENLRHGREGEGIFPVCRECDAASKWHVFDTKRDGLNGGGAPLTAKEVLMMRAYFCSGCSRDMKNPQAWHRSGQNVYGFDKATRGDADPAREEFGEPGNMVSRGEWKSEMPLPISGCNCMEKLLNRVLCSYHRLFLAQKMIRQAAMMQEYRFRRYGSKICPRCQARPGLDSTTAQQEDNLQRFWVCLVCNGTVASGERGSARRIASGRAAWDWYAGWINEGGGEPWKLEVAARGIYPPGYGEQEFDIEVRSPGSSDDGEGEVVEED